MPHDIVDKLSCSYNLLMGCATPLKSLSIYIAILYIFSMISA